VVLTLCRCTSALMTASSQISTTPRMSSRVQKGSAVRGHLKLGKPLDMQLFPSCTGRGAIANVVCALLQVHKRTDDGLISDIYYAQDVIEGPKGSAVGAHLKLGKPLEISFLGANGGFERYEDLDEIIARFVEPYVAQLKQIKGHR